MGLWWKHVEATPPSDEEAFVTFEADPLALSKNYPILWRFSQNWRYIYVDAAAPYRFFFRSADGTTMMCRRRLWQEFVAVRVGTEKVTFWAEDTLGNHPMLRDVGILNPAFFRWDTRDTRHRDDAQYFKSIAAFI